MLISIKKKEISLTYKEIAQRVNPPMSPRNVGRNIGEVAKLCNELGLPLISAIVVNSYTNNPGDGFYNIAKNFYLNTNGLNEKELYKLERQKIRECTEWYKLSDYLQIDIDLPRPKPSITAETQSDIPDLEIRILPMSKTLEFPTSTYEDVQKEYFLNELIHIQDGIYNFRESGMLCPPGSLILFQFSNAIIASAILREVIKYEEPLNGISKGSYVFYKDSIQIFQPITLDEIKQIDSSIKAFNLVKQKIDYIHINKIQDLIKAKKSVLIPEELPLAEISTYHEGAKRQITVNAYERNPIARGRCIQEQGTSCKICEFDFKKAYGDLFDGKIHVHHIKPLAEVNAEYDVDPINDLIPVCPNCHFIIHSKIPAYTPAEVKNFVNRKHV